MLSVNSTLTLIIFLSQFSLFAFRCVIYFTGYIFSTYCKQQAAPTLFLGSKCTRVSVALLGKILNAHSSPNRYSTACAEFLAH